MSHTEMAPAETPEGHALDFKFEVVGLPVTDGEIAAAREPIGAKRKS